MAARKPSAKVDPLHSVKTEVCASLGETYFKVECPLHLAGAVALRLHAELKQLVKADPELGHIARTVHGGALDVSDAEYYEEARTRPRPLRPLGFGK